MQSPSCATCGASSLKSPRLVDGSWYALCTECLFETEMESLGADAFRAKGVAEISAQQLADLGRPGQAL
jgi:hypothetical protein